MTKHCNRKRLDRYEEGRAAIFIAKQWLKGAENALAVGCAPAKLTECLKGAYFVSGHLEELGMFRDLTEAAKERISKDAVFHAVAILKDGRFPTVRAHFEALRK